MVYSDIIVNSIVNTWCFLTRLGVSHKNNHSVTETDNYCDVNLLNKRILLRFQRKTSFKRFAFLIPNKKRSWRTFVCRFTKVSSLSHLQNCLRRLMNIAHTHTCTHISPEQIMVIRLCQDNTLPRYDHRSFCLARDKEKIDNSSESLLLPSGIWWGNSKGAICFIVLCFTAPRKKRVA